MPFTPFHIGPGAAIKVVGGRHFSLTLFTLDQIAMDIEPLVRLNHEDSLLHGISHSYLGATVIAATVALIGWPCCQFMLRLWNKMTGLRFLRWLQRRDVISRPAAFSGAFLGGYSHVFLDSIMHADMKPWFPFSESNGLLYTIPSGWLHVFCAVLGIAGAMGLLILFIWDKIAIEI